MATNPFQVLVARAGIHDRAEKRVVQEVDDGVVDHSARLIQQAPVERLARLLEFPDIVGQQSLKKAPDADALEIHDTHMRDIEHAGSTAHGMMLGDLRGVLHRHVPATEIDNAGTELPVEREQGCLSSHDSSGHRASVSRAQKKGAGTKSYLPPLCPVT